MADRIFFQNRDKDYKFRMDMARFLDPSEERASFINSAIISQIKQISKYEIYQVTVEEKAPDYIALLKYGSHEYWWIIMLYNNLLEFDEIKAGMSLRVPDKTTIDNIIAASKVQESQIENGIFNISLYR